MNKIYLDTPIVINRVFDTMENQISINKKLKDNQLVISDYVIGELKNNILRQCCEVYNALNNGDNPFECILKCSSSVYSVAWYNRLIKILSYLYNQSSFQNSSSLKENIKDRLYILIDSFNDFVIPTNIDRVSTIQCKRADAVADYNENADMWDIDIIEKCSADVIPNCLMSEFISENKENFNTLISTEIDIGTQQYHLNKLLGKGCKKYGLNCWLCGDSLISLMMPKGQYIMFTTDKKHTIPICKALNKGFLND